MVSDLLRNYSFLLKHAKTSDLTLTLLGTLLGKVGLPSSDDFVKPILSIINRVGDPNISLFEILSKPELIAELEALVDIAAKSETKPSPVGSTGDIVDTGTVLPCPHCGLPFALMDAMGR